MQPNKPILLNVPIALLKRIDQASAAMSLSRSELMRRSLSRDLEFVLQHEILRLSRAKEENAFDYLQWANNAI